MKEPTKKRNPPKTGSASTKPRQKSGRKSSATKESKAPAGQGAARLRDSVNKMVGEQSDAIAQALIDKAIEGDSTCTRLVFEVSGAKNAPPEKQKKRGPQPWITRMSTEPELPGPWDEQRKRDASRLPLSDFDLPDELK